MSQGNGRFPLAGNAVEQLRPRNPFWFDCNIDLGA